MPLQRSIRSHLHRLLQYNTLGQVLFLSPSLTDEESDAFVLGGIGSPTPQHFRIDFIRPWKTFSYNRCAREVFCRDFVLALAEGEYIPPEPVWAEHITLELVGDALDAHIRWIRRVL
ncbi:hypothetical protein OH76DRAFT_1481331 [Lentinus brumalis]|uniref:Uncharacterized protein n=1 Tax=Lentinus brumalis TaxID=2498619 RepID=A0A371DH01_9APHY|nr:hypothetical protein OH76DRAFT_1481331 [Polyporus brumalis]